MRFAFRGLELHGREMWDRARIVQSLSFMRAHGLNALILHESDLVHQVVYPRAYFDPYALWKDAPSRRGENAIFNNRAYLEHVLRLARDAGIAVWLNVKEIGFSDEVLALRPDLVKDGAVCPSEPFWTDYVGYKTAELFSDFPLLEGLIVSFGSQESRASRSQNRCRCELCRREPLADWYLRLIRALHAPIAAHGKRLAVRDFAYKPEDHAPLVDAMRRSPADTIFCIKSMPHDFYITFPDNPAIGAVARDQWIEYDVMGQFFGWGVFPCLVIDDTRARLDHAERNGVRGAIFRIEWERINDLCSFDNLSEVNLIAAAALARGDMIDATAACRQWLASKGWKPDAAPWLAATLSRTLSIVRKAAYIGGFVFADNSMLPRSVKRAWWGMLERDSLSAWDPARAADLSIDRERMVRFLREKEDALRETKALLAHVDVGDATLESEFHAWIRSQFAHYETWVRGLYLCARVCLYARWIETARDGLSANDLRDFEDAIGALEAFAAEVAPLWDDTSISHHVPMMIDHRRASDVAREARSIVSALALPGE